LSNPNTERKDDMATEKQKAAARETTIGKDELRRAITRAR
jgi:hypothetical protein